MPLARGLRGRGGAVDRLGACQGIQGEGHRTGAHDLDALLIRQPPPAVSPGGGPGVEEIVERTGPDAAFGQG